MATQHGTAAALRHQWYEGMWSRGKGATRCSLGMPWFIRGDGHVALAEH